MLNVHSVSGVNILHDSSGVLRAINYILGVPLRISKSHEFCQRICDQDPCITRKTKKHQKNSSRWPERRVRFMWRRLRRWKSSADGPNRMPRLVAGIRSAFTDLQIVHTCAHSNLGTATPGSPWCGAVSKWRLREVLRSTPLWAGVPFQPGPQKFTESGPSDWSESPASTAMTGWSFLNWNHQRELPQISIRC